MKKFLVPVLIIIVVIILVVVLTSSAANAKIKAAGGNPGDIKIIDALGKEKYLSPEKYAVWKQIQDYVVRILTSEDWKPWRDLNSFKALTNGGKIDAVHEQVKKYTDLYNRGYQYGQPGGFSYKDFYYPGIDINNLGAGSQNAFQLLIAQLGPDKIKNIITILTATMAGGPAAGVMSVAAIYQQQKNAA